MGEAEQCTRSMELWAATADEEQLGTAIGEAIPGAWRCSPPGAVGLHPLHFHATLSGALECHGVQAFLHLPPTVIDVPVQAYQPGSDGAVAVLQYLRGRVSGGVWSTGRLAVRWNRHEVGAAMHGWLSSATRAAFTNARRVLPPATVATPDGTERRLGRIGAAARDRVRHEGLMLSRGSVNTYTLH